MDIAIGQSGKVAAVVPQKLHCVVGYIVRFSAIQKTSNLFMCLSGFASVLMQYAARSLRGRNTRSEKVARRGLFSVLLRRIVVTTQRKRTEKWTAVALLQ